MSPTIGYSGTPLARKLGIKQGYKILLHQAPDHYWTLFDELPEDVEQLSKGKKESLDFIHLFATNSKDLEKALTRTLPWLKKEGALWISWPKKTAAIETELDKWQVMKLGQAAGLVDVKVAAIDETWSGHKFMYRVKDR